LAILRSAARLVKPGGRLVYATCSLLREENEGIAEAFAQAEAGWKLVPAVQALAPLKLGDAQALCRGDFLRLWPHRHGTDGFFAAVWERI
jgi:16S rRNA (cytosine967-C5)-methyltransferase